MILELPGLLMPANTASNPRRVINFDASWKFFQGDIAAAKSSDYNDKDWRSLNLPHDWSIEGRYDTIYHTDWQSGYLPAGIGWYRKSFNWDKVEPGKKISLIFDGIYMNSDVWINGHLLGHRPNGYLGLDYDITGYLKKGTNLVAVRVDNSKPLSARWYTGAGIYRHVWLKITNQLYINDEDNTITTPLVTKDSAHVLANTTITNKSGSEQTVALEIKLTDHAGKQITVARSVKKIDAGQTGNYQAILQVTKPHLWSPDKPYLYKLINTITVNGRVKDQTETNIGIRKIVFRADSGFFLNGKQTKIKGVGMHQDAGPVGVAVPDDVLLRRLKLLKQMGCNAIRTTHHPFSPVFYNICDSLGIMVLDELFDGWEQTKAPDDYGNYFKQWWQKDAADFVKRDRNHPSVIMWSIGNEVRKPTIETQKKLIDLFHVLDPTRPVTQGGHDPTRGMKGGKTRTLLDVYGFNGDGEEIGAFERFHQSYPDVPIVGTEVPHTYQTRGYYHTQTTWRVKDFPAKWEIDGGSAGKMKDLSSRVFPIPDLSDHEVFSNYPSTYYQDGQHKPINNPNAWAKGLYYQSSYDNATVRISAREAWKLAERLPYLMGEFRWGSFDYLGENNQWPSRMANFGVLDDCGFPKDQYYLYQSLWTTQPMVHILPHWTYPGMEGKVIPVVAYTNCDEVELFLNNKSLGKKAYHGSQLVWQVPYQPGTLKAVASIGGKQQAIAAYRTAGTPFAIKVGTDKKALHAKSEEAAHIAVSIIDKNGVEVPTANNQVIFSVQGPGKLIGVDNGDPLDLSSYKHNKRLAFMGKCLGIVQPTATTGVINIKLSSPGLKPAMVQIKVNRR